MASAGSSSGSCEIATNTATSSTGNTRYVTRVGIQRCRAANPTRPMVTLAQNAVSASEACVVDAPMSFMSSDAQFPFIVSQMP